MVKHPIGAMQKHDAWAASDIADLTNKIAIVSGSTSGLDSLQPQSWRGTEHT